MPRCQAGECNSDTKVRSLFKKIVIKFIFVSQERSPIEVYQYKCGQLDSWKPSYHMVVCLLHFTPDSYVRDLYMK